MSDNAKRKKHSTAIAKKQHVYRISRADQLQVLAVPLRQRIIDSLSGQSSPCSIKQIATLVGRPPDALYFHVRKLKQVGLLVEEKPTTEFGKPVRTYRTPGREMVIQFNLSNPDFQEQMVRIASAVLRLAERDYKHCISSGKAVGEGEQRNVWAGRVEGCLSAKALAELNLLCEKAVAIFASRQTCSEGQRVAFTMSIATLDESLGENGGHHDARLKQ